MAEHNDMGTACEQVGRGAHGNCQHHYDHQHCHQQHFYHAYHRYHCCPCMQGIPTRAQLVDRWAGVSRVSRQLSAIPQGQGGPLSIAVASLASALKVCQLKRAHGSFLNQLWLCCNAATLCK